MIRRAIVSFGCCVLMFCSSVQADINDGLDGMFVTTGNEPTIYQSQRRMGVDLGTFRLRAPMSRVNVINITPPQLRSGCGGIDLYGGSFTFINGEQFRQILRQIGANALGYAFKLALATMCEKCDAILTGLQAKVDELNRMQVDSCRWGVGLVNEFASAAKFKVNEDAKQEGVTLAEVEDGFQSIVQDFTDGNWLSKGNPSGANPDNKDVGNITFNALVNSDVATRFSFVPGSLSHNELLMNIAGTFILREADSTEAEEGTTTQELSRRLSYDELKSGKSPSSAAGEDALPLMSCNDNVQCLKPTDAGEWSFTGVSTWAEERLREAGDHMANPATAGADHAADLQDFLATLPLTVVRHMQVMQGDDASLNTYVDHVHEYVGAAYSATLALAMVDVIRSAFSRTDAPTMPDNVKAHLLEFERDAKADLKDVQRQYSKQWRETEELVADLTRPIGQPGTRVGRKE